MLDTPVMRYRRDIDGLRCLAVVPVVLCHAGAEPFSGGFVGVDVFFVLSGFLITSIMRQDIARGTFAITGFYERRCRRIVPALVTVILGCLAAGYFIMLPGQYSDLSESAIAALLFFSNVFFWNQTGYFAPVAEWMPLLHTWSLAVEEQYYIAFPVFMLLTRRWRPSRQVVVLGIVFILSLVISAYGAFNRPSATFYLTPFRVWELLLGVLVAYLPSQIHVPRRLRELLSAAGLLMLVLPVFLYDERTPFPGLAAIPPCLGTGILLVTGQAGPSLVKSLLDNRILVFVGLVSYSLYLWHWPVFVFIRLHSAQTHLAAGPSMLGTVVAFCLAVLSWRFVERPFRSTAFLSRNMVFGLSAGSVLFCLVAASTVRGFDGLPRRVPSAASVFEQASDDVDPLKTPCHGRIGDSACQFGGRRSSPITFALWGDSHAAVLRPALEEAMRASGKRGTLLWLGGCPPLLGLEKVGEPDADECAAFRKRAITFLNAPNSSIQTVFISGRWLPLATGTSAEVGGSFVQLIRDAESVELGTEENQRVFARSLERTIEALLAGDKEIVLLGGTPDIGWHVPTILALSVQHEGQVPRLASRNETAVIHAAVDAAFRVAAQHEHVSFVPIWQLLCTDTCPIVADNQALYSDDDHLSFYGAREFLGPKLSRAFETAGIGIAKK